MRPRTISTTFPKEVAAVCRRDDRLDDLDITGHGYWLGILYEGNARFEVEGQTVNAVAPCFICFDERCSPRLICKRQIQCDSVYFDPTYINVNMTFDRIREAHYEEVAARHDFFLMKPFVDREAYVFPLYEESLARVRQTFAGMEREFLHQEDWYWSCRSRSYFMELILLVERTYSYATLVPEDDTAMRVRSSHLQRALVYMESHYAEDINLSSITHGAGINHTTLTQLFKAETGMTPMEYLWHYRIATARRQLEFTALPIKHIAARCGFKTVQHFCRKFEQEAGMTPGKFRTQRYRERVTELGSTQGCRAGMTECAAFDA